VLRVSARTDVSGLSIDYLFIQPNGLSTNQSGTRIQGNGAAASSQRYTNFYMPIDGSTATSNTFANAEIYIPNYANSSNKVFSYNAITENNSATAYIETWAALWSSTSAITSLTLGNGGANLVTGSSFYLYGISNA
jgi:Ca2+-binding RTX toxin-like protein